MCTFFPINWPFLNQCERMTVETISLTVSVKECYRTFRIEPATSWSLVPTCIWQSHWGTSSTLYEVTLFVYKSKCNIIFTRNCTALHHGLTINQVSVWFDVKCWRTKAELKKFTDRRTDGRQTLEHNTSRFSNGHIKSPCAKCEQQKPR